MSRIRIAFFDIDGTLVDPATGRISELHRQTLRRLGERGILRCIVTGRPPVCLPDLGDVQVDAVATFNGSFCRAGETTVCSNPVDPADVDQVLKNAAALGRPVSLALRDRLVANGWEPDLAGYYRLAGIELTVEEDFEDALREDIYQVMLGCRPADHPAILRGTKHVKMAVSWDRAADVIPADGGKGKAIGQILAHYGLEKADAIAFGDNLNDLDMLQAVGTGVAMGNAAPELKAVADAVCEPVSDDGIYRYCLSHGLI